MPQQPQSGAQPRPPGGTAARWRTWAVRLAAAYLTGVLAATVFAWTAADAWWPATLFVFGPRWPVAVPLAVLGPLAAATRSSRAGGLLVVAAGVAAGPLLGGRVAVPRLAGRPADSYAVRVMTWNTAGAGLKSPVSRQYVAAVRPDLILLQEAASPDPGDVPPGFAVVGEGGGTVTLSRLPAEPRGRLTAADFGASGGCARVLVETPVGSVVVVNVHLPTTRPGIEAVLSRRLAGVAELEEVTRVRDRASAVVAAWVGPPTDGAIVAGDFNTPVESTVFRRDWGGFGNAFSAAGTGWEPTKLTRWFGVRIDHVLFAPPWECRGVATGPPMGSDHRPVVADLVYRVE